MPRKPVDPIAAWCCKQGQAREILGTGDVSGQSRCACRSALEDDAVQGLIGALRYQLDLDRPRGQRALLHWSTDAAGVQLPTAQHDTGYMMHCSAGGENYGISLGLNLPRIASTSHVEAPISVAIDESPHSGSLLTDHGYTLDHSDHTFTRIPRCPGRGKGDLRKPTTPWDNYSKPRCSRPSSIRYAAPMERASPHSYCSRTWVLL